MPRPKKELPVTVGLTETPQQFIDETRLNITARRVDELERKLDVLEKTVKFVLEQTKLVAKEQSSKTTSGSFWFTNFIHQIMVKEKEMGWGPGPKTEKPV